MKDRRTIFGLDMQFKEFYNNKMAKFLDEDKQILADICKKYPVIMERSYTSDSLGKKSAAWRIICQEFNASNPRKPPRDVAQIQGLWKQMKLKAKDERCMRRKEAMKTGDSPSILLPSTSTLIVEEMIDGSWNLLDMQFDSDNVQESATAEEMHEFDDCCEVIQEEDQESNEQTAASSKRNRIQPDDDKEEFLQMARAMHEERMKNVQELLEIQKEKIKKEISILEIKERTALLKNAALKMKLAWKEK
ncbi:hypothetical protein L9F63_000557 [Diploptera punctata]|uniref:Regulatory protein zeste n=1 Tax=Diploptera punctata TaxID=6984 RepID=A0AAD8AN15_DIPPU|nr:hypothetical protein L9F63_000557 [Diploptera punctata]